MDAHVFRRVGAVFTHLLPNARLERIHEPVAGITAFSLYLGGRKQCLFFRGDRSQPFLFLTDKSPLPNPAFPPASVMRLRKYAEGRILGEGRCNWVDRQLAFAMPGSEETPAAWLLFDCKTGPSIIAALPEGFAAQPAWPDPAALTALLSPDASSPAPWEAFRVLTPQLRRSLLVMDPPDAAALLVDLEEGKGDLFWYSPEAGGPPRALSAWPLPAGQEEAAGLRERAAPADAEHLLAPLAAMYLPHLFAAAKTRAAAPALKQDKAAARRRKRLCDKLEEEKKRLGAMLALGDEARLLQTNLWRFAPEERMAEVSLHDPAAPDAPAQKIRLDERCSIAENMQTMFRKAAKAARGLGMLEERIRLARQAPLTSAPSAPRPDMAEAHKKPGKKSLFSPSRIQEFLSSDGFTLWRGRNAEGNRALLKLARPFDLWFHVEDGPSAHLLLRRDHAAQEVPEKTLREAAVLVGLKSWRKDDPRAPVMVALAKHVHPVKGGPSGTVHVQEQWRSLLAALDPALEQVLRPQTDTRNPTTLSLT